MVKLSIQVTDILDVLNYYDKIKIYRADSEGGAYTEITDSATRLNLIPETTIYNFTDSTGDNTKWYKTSYFNSSTLAESDLSDARQGQTEEDKIGYTFRNYKAPNGEWGELYTADDMRYTMLFGIDCVGSDIAKTEFSDEQFKQIVDEALSEFEILLTIDIRKKIYKTEPSASLTRSPIWREGVDYTHEEDPYDFDYKQWDNFGFIQLRHFPVISVDSLVWYSVVDGKIMDMLEANWLRLKKETGQINLYPKGGMPYGPFSIYGPFWSRATGRRYPGGFKIDYTTGYPTADYVPESLRAVIGKYATIKALAVVGDGLLAGFSSQSISLDGLSESFSSTQSATSAYFGARIAEYQKEITEWLKRNRYKFGGFPMSFVGS